MVQAPKLIVSGAPCAAAERGPSLTDPRLRRAFESHLDKSETSCDAGVTLSEDALPGSDSRLLVVQLSCGVGEAQLPATTAKGISDISLTAGREPGAGAASPTSRPGMFTTGIAVFEAEPPAHAVRIECEITSGVWTGTTLALEGRARHGCTALLVVGIPDRLWRASATRWVDLTHKLQRAVQGIVVVEAVRGQAAARDVPE